MQFIDGIGIQATSTEIAALLSFCKDDESKIAIKLEGGKLLSWAACGVAAIYHHGEARDGNGKPSKSAHQWQIAADALSMIRRGMAKGDEVILTTGKKLDILSADIRDIKTGNKKPSIGLEGFVSEQLELNMPKMLPERPGRRTGEVPTDQVALSFTVISLLSKVCKAAESETARFFINSDPHQPLYVEVDKPSRLYDEEQPRWICVLMPMKLAAAVEFDADDDADPAGGDDEE